MTIAPAFLFDRTPKTSAADLISRFSDAALASPFRSTVPLLALAKDDWPTFANVLALCGLAGDVSVAFEHTVRSPKGEGRPSCTDAMATTERAALAIEAKWTEPRYETVATRLKRKNSKGQDSRPFIEGWLELLQPHSSKTLHLDDFANSIYQIVHRSASACGVGKPPRLAYLHFTTSTRSPTKRPKYREDLSAVHELLGRPKGFPFFLIELPMQPRAAFRAIERLKKGEASSGAAVRAALLAGVLFEFDKPFIVPDAQ